MMSIKIVTLVSLLSVLFGSCQASNLQLSIYNGNNQWWMAVTVTGGASPTSTIEVQESGSSIWTSMGFTDAWGYWAVNSAAGSSNGFNFPVSFRLTSITGQVVVLPSILTSVSAGVNIATSAQYSSGVESASNPVTAAPTVAPTQKATTAPTQAATQAPTQKATTAPTQKATTAPTQAATQAPTQRATSAPTVAPTQKATSAPTQAPTQKATSAPTQAPTAAPTKKATVAPTSAATSTSLCAVSSTVAEPVKFLVPLYIYPGSAWTEVANAARTGVQVIAIINPNSGPDAAGPDSSYTTYMAQLAAAGVTMVGYVHTSYGDRAIADVKADIATYAALYPGLSGIFVDECALSTAELSYYAQVYSAAQSYAGYEHTIVNPGAQPDVGYLDVSTNIVIFEDIATNWNSQFSSWVSCAPTAATKANYKYKFSAISYATSASQMAALLPEFAAAGIGMVYATNGAAGDSTYDSLPSYFTTLASAVSALN